MLLIENTTAGIVLYEHQPNNAGISSSTQNLSSSNRELLNQFITNHLLSESMGTSKQQQNQQITLYPTQATSGGSNTTVAKTGVVADWEYFHNDDEGTKENFNKKPWVAVAFHSEILLNRKDMSFVKRFLKILLKEYALFYDTLFSQDNHHPLFFLDAENTQLFDNTYTALWKRMEGMAKRTPNNSSNNINEIHQQTKSAKESFASSSKKKPEKKKTVWHDGAGKITKATMAQLDRSKDGDSANTDSIEAAMADDSAALREARAAYLPSSDEIPSWLEKDEEGDLNDDDTNENGGDGSSSWSFNSLFDRMSGNKVLSVDDLTPPLTEMERMLISKNVAQEIAKEICDGVKSKLVGKRMHTFSRVKSTVRSALEHSISQILSPHRDIDMLRQVLSKRDSFFQRTKNVNKPYVIVMVGINGVGKSTSLAKIAYFLKSNGCSPLLAACDTFRSGAVEQLGVHAKCLNVPLFHKGYAKDPSLVAKAAITEATESKNDVVLIDTAGRMQNNLPLMKALRKLIAENQPDLVIFVGEALVGNDGLNQLQMFDKALSSEGRGDGRHGVDGIILSKFDTVGEKVGAALSMAKLSGKPVLFAGVGQKYGHLKKLSVNSVINSLFS